LSNIAIRLVEALESKREREKKRLGRLQLAVARTQVDCYPKKKPHRNVLLHHRYGDGRHKDLEKKVEIISFTKNCKVIFHVSLVKSIFI